MGCKITISLPRELNAVIGDGFFPCVMNGIRRKSNVTGILGCDTDQAIDKLAAGDINALALIQF